jgi:hypothetical protein
MMTDNKELQTIETSMIDLMPLETVARAIEQVEDLKKRYMKVDQDYGEYAGVDKPVILKPGMEKLALMFNLAPRYDIVERIIEPHQEWVFEVSVKTYQSKYPNTICNVCNNPVSKGAMICKNGSGYAHQKCFMQNAEISGSGEVIQKKKGVGYYHYVVRCNLVNKATGDTWCSALGECSSRDRGKENAPSNTILKMAEKRAFGAAVQNATCSSHLFTVDIDDDPTFEKKKDSPKSKPEPKPKKYQNTPPEECLKTLEGLLSAVGDIKGLNKLYKDTPDLRERASMYVDPDTGDELGADGINNMFAQRKSELKEG